jgi:hypothetical protein
MYLIYKLTPPPPVFILFYDLKPVLVVTLVTFFFSIIRQYMEEKDWSLEYLWEVR